MPNTGFILVCVCIYKYVREAIGASRGGSDFEKTVFLLWVMALAYSGRLKRRSNLVLL